MDSMPNDLTVGEVDRYQRLVDLFGEPTNDAEQYLLKYLARWLLPGSTAALEDMVARVKER